MNRWLSSWHIDFSDHDNDIFKLTQVHIGLMPNTEPKSVVLQTQLRTMFVNSICL